MRLFQPFSNHPLAVFELRLLQKHTQKRWNHMRLLLFALALVVAVTPLWLYMDMNQTPTLVVMAVVIYLAHIVVGMRTMLLAINAVAREQRAGTWDTLILTGIDARQIVWGKWWAVVRCVWKDHALMALPRVGLAFGLAQYLNFSVMDTRIWGTVFTYYSCGGYVACSAINPQGVTTATGALVIMLFGIVEAGLVAAVGLLIALLATQATIAQFPTGVAIRAMLVIAAIMIVRVGHIKLGPLLEFHCSISPSCVIPEDGTLLNETSRDELNIVAYTFERFKETAQIALSPLIDSGTLLTANIMRPFGDGTEFGKIYERGVEKFSLVSQSNLLFVLRNLVAWVLGLGLYALIITGVLRLAERAAVRRHGALRVGSA